MGQAEISSILVIGNNAHFCYLMRRYIRKSMFQPLFSSLGEEALALAQREKPSAIVLEVDHRGTSSRKILNLLRGFPDTRDIPVVLCSWQEDTHYGLQESASTCLRMPILYEDFKAALEKLLTKEQDEKGF
jgi:two-component system cell cycle response regulator